MTRVRNVFNIGGVGSTCQYGRSGIGDDRHDPCRQLLRL